MALNIDRKSSGDLIAVSTTPQADEATAATIDRLIQFDEDSFIRQTREAETNEEEKTGYLEATDVDVLGRAAELQLNQSKATPDAIAWALRQVFGAPTTSAVGTGFSHVFKLASYPDNPDYFTSVHRKGGASAAAAPAAYERFRGLALGSIELSADKGDFFRMALGGVGIGTFDDAIVTEEKTAVDFSVGTFTLTNDPEGASDAEMATKIFATADYDDDGHFERVLTISSYVSMTNTVTFDNTGINVGTHNIRVTYEQDHTLHTWIAEATGVSVLAEYKLKATNMRLYLNANPNASDATPANTGAIFAECELDTFTYTLDRNAEAGRCWAVSDPPDEQGFAQQVELGQVTQRLTLSRGIVDWLIKQNYDLSAAFGIEIWSRGPEWEPGNRYEVHLLFPYCKILNLTQEVDDAKWRDSVEVAILQDPGTAAGGIANNQLTAVAVIQNEESSYA